MLSLQNLKDVLADLIPKEQTRIKNFKQQYGKTNIGQINVDMVSNSLEMYKQDGYMRTTEPDSSDPLY